MKEIKKAFIDSIPVLMGYMVLGMAFGMLLESKGYGVFYAFLMSLLVYAGSMQFVAINLITSGASLISSALMTLLINARHLVYGLSMIKPYEKVGKIKPYLIYSLTDETYSLLVSQSDASKEYMFYVSLFNHCYWVSGSVIGSLLGSMLTINTTGLDFAMTALFIVIVLEQFLSQDKHIYNYLGFIMSIASLLLFGQDTFLIPAMIGIIVGLMMMYKRGKKHE